MLYIIMQEVDLKGVHRAPSLPCASQPEAASIELFLHFHFSTTNIDSRYTPLKVTCETALSISENHVNVTLADKQCLRCLYFYNTPCYFLAGTSGQEVGSAAVARRYLDNRTDETIIVDPVWKLGVGGLLTKFEAYVV